MLSQASPGSGPVPSYSSGLLSKWAYQLKEKSKVPLTPGKKQPQFLALWVLTVVVDMHDLSQVYSVPVASAVHLSVCPYLPITKLTKASCQAHIQCPIPRQAMR